MRIRPKNPTDRFSTDEQAPDHLERIELGTNLTTLYSNLEDGTVAILHGRWGVGKTTFARRWANQLRDQGFGVFYFDAFAHDYIGEPFDALMAAVLRTQKLDDTDKNDSSFKKLKERAAAVSKSLGRTGVKAGVRIATLNAIEASDLEALADAAKGVSGDLADAADEAAKSLLERRAKDLGAFEEFRASLSEIHKISGGNDDKYKKGFGKTIFLVDELDRCRPDFALSLLESLKHFFRTDGLHFVLVTNRDYLARSVNFRYGLEESSDEYLQKFYDFTIYFEEATASEHQHHAATFGKNVIRELIGHAPSDASYNLQRNVAYFAQAFNMTLRQVEQMATGIALAYMSLGERTFAPPMLIVVLSFLKAHHPKIYSQIKTRTVKADHVLAVLAAGNWPKEFNWEFLHDMVTYYLKEEIDLADSRYNRFTQGSDRYFLDRLDTFPFLANGVLDTYSRN